MIQMKIIIGTKNPAKIIVVRSVFEKFFNVTKIETISHAADSGVPEAPHGRETFDGAINRAYACQNNHDADYYVGIESGLVNRYGHDFEEAWAIILTSDGEQRIGYSSGLMLPSIVKKRMENGEKHNDIMAHFDKKFDLPDDNRDTWSRYTGGHISRQVSLEEAVRNALIQDAPSEQNLYRHS